MSGYAIGALVKARGRDWVVLPESNEGILMVRPLGGTDDEVTALFLPVEDVRSAHFELPDPSRAGDFRSSRLLRDAVRLSVRSSAGPFRSFARISVEPRPYQLVPLLLALKLDPVRLLIADDVGVGKTIEACLIARELLDRGEVKRLAVLCPPHLAEQWQEEMAEKFQIAAELVLASTVERLERSCNIGESLFERFPFVIVSTDFIKSERRRQEFLRACPELVIVDEAHTSASDGAVRGGRHQRHHLLKGLAEDRNRHILLITATPHSGNEDAFRSLLALLSPDLAGLPADLSGKENEAHRRHLAAHFVQRRRGDVTRYLQSDTPFPEREESEETYKLSPAYRQLFDKALAYARETVQDKSGTRHQQRVRWWSALALLRALASSPVAASATLRRRASVADTETVEEADEIGQRSILDLADDEAAERLDVSPGSDIEVEDSDLAKQRRRLRDMAADADKIRGESDQKLMIAATLLTRMLNDGYRPIVFCRFIDTAEYLATELRKRWKDTELAAVTGALPPDERVERVLDLAKHPRRVLVATDCLSEGINLQDHFDAVFHYDLSWNPTRHEQREGRADRFGQGSPKVRMLTFYGVDNQVDGVVLEVLLRKHRTIRKTLGVSVPVPGDANRVIEAIFEGLLLRDGGPRDPGIQLGLFGDAYMGKKRAELYSQWEAAESREKVSRTLFAQHGVKVEEVAAELAAIRDAVGSPAEAKRFFIECMRTLGALISEGERVEVNLQEQSRALRDAIHHSSLISEHDKTLRARFTLPVAEDELYLHRTHPCLEGLASFVLDSALDSAPSQLASRCGVISTRQVPVRTTLLIVRFRHHITTVRGPNTQTLLAEECRLVAFAGAPTQAKWLDAADAESLLSAEPAGNILPETARVHLEPILQGYETLVPQLEQFAAQRAALLLEAHRRVRRAAQWRGIRYTVEPVFPVDLIGVYVFLPRAV